ncbi:bifunctional diaminohydroxyphosphoribosylaminopyrimidine deaminase/5-amino-6-(5-phosphoribosylamino)uracil reductase RibD [Kosmotoga pacifica]|uniref:bifunctional diaminohydroxyphosphoribosylaminopyrimidine deaminase/5-amino-6-(5-phosphoribosylamino)uracil reductase RibD n=1 Tax=Kosmotoga pacifica TaxID=1330330 RepID=UPI0009E43B76|nr:bifunctional diaminohydroxyphosphoribosylaminopyrimidine deaminase/5-amino-6-(5-phosphoribosylamino)uracil reductase RibD [Kosmotoga pacifica]
MDEKFMKLAIEEAKKGEGLVNPNPLVGAVIVKNGKILSTGYHEYFGGRHAEIVAIENAKKLGYDIKGAEMYVTLEPCVHYGKTPPCVDRIIEEGFSAVYIGTLDPNPMVHGGGKRKLMNAGIHVKHGILEGEAKELIEVFTKYMKTRMPFVALKLAMSLDGFIAKKRGKRERITSDRATEKVHRLRNYYSAIMIGATTAISDDPLLTCRYPFCKRNPIRVILDRSGKTAKMDLKLFALEGRTIIFTSSNEYWPENVEVIRRDDLSPESILKTLGKMGMDSILVEGGANVASQFIKHADKIHLFYAPVVFGNGLSPFECDFKGFTTKKVEVHHPDIYWELIPCSQE